MSLVAHHLESEGIPTVVIGSARDIVEEAGVPRFLFVDFPLGNPIGKPGDVEMQRSVVKLALDMVPSTIAARTTVQSPARWGSDDWRANFMRVDDSNRELLAATGAARKKEQADFRAKERAKK